MKSTKEALPTWLTPVQFQVIPVSPSVHLDYAKKVQERLQLEGLRVELDSRDEKIGYKIREAQMQKIPYMLVVGDQEAENGAVNVRKYGEQDSETMDLEAFVKHAVAEAKK